MRYLALRLIALWGWRRALLALCIGAASALAMAPVHLVPVLLFTVPVLIWLLDGVHAQARSPWHALRSGGVVGLCFGFGYFLAGLHWIGAAFFVEAETFAWMMPVIMTALPLGLALFWALACGLAMLVWSSGIARFAGFAALITAAEWARGTVLTGFPWNTPGYAAAPSLEISQLASVTGVFGLTFFVMFIAALPAAFADDGGGRKRALPAPWLALGLMLGLLVMAWTAGQQMLGEPRGANETAPHVRIVQPNIDQRDKWNPALRSDIFANYLDLSDTATSPEYSGISDIDVVVWPESALPFFVEETPNALAAIAALVPDRVTLLTGGLRRSASSGGEVEVFNSVLAINGDGDVTHRYDKFHLVPYGEYLPFEKVLSRFGFRRLVTVPASFTAGAGPVTLSVTGLPAFSPLICYEIAFPGAVTEPGNRPDWILNVTNDAWFGGSIGPFQHFQQARFRAIEEGLPVIRAANTGISAVIDSKGRILRSLDFGTRGVIDARLPEPAPLTVYAMWGHAILPALLLFGLILSGVGMLIERNRDDTPKKMAESYK